MIVYEKNELLDYLYKYLNEHEGNVSANEGQQFRTRFEHTKRVLRWMNKLFEAYNEIEDKTDFYMHDKSIVRHEILELAVIFHDIGYEKENNEYHALRSSEIFYEFAKEKGWDIENSEEVEDIRRLIRFHSDKKLLDNPETDMELVLLMEADSLDEEGTMRVVWDCLLEGYRKTDSYEKVYEQLCRSFRPGKNPMVTPLARKIWQEKWDLVDNFKEKLRKDLFF